MALEIPCPNCRAVLRVPPEVAAAMAGRRAKCKKCGHRFPLPGVPSGKPADGSVLLSEAEKPTPAAANPFGFDEGDAVVAPRKHGSTARHRRGPDDARRPAGRSKSPVVIVLVLGVLGVGLLSAAAALAGVVYLLTARPAPVADAAPRPEMAKATRPPGGKVPPNEAVLPPIPPPPEEATAPAAKDAMPAPKPAVGGSFVTLPTPPAGPRKLVAPARVTILLDAPLDAVRDVKFSAGSPQVVAVLWRSNAGFQGAGVTDTLDIYPAGGKGRLARLELLADGLPPGGPRRLALSPDGKHAATELPAGKLTVFQVASGKPVIDGVDPFADAPDAKGLAFLAFLDDRHVAVLDRAGNGQAWDVAAGQGVAPDPARPKRTVFGPALSEVVKGAAYTYVGPVATRVALTPKSVAGPDQPLPGAQAGAYNFAAGAAAVAADGQGRTFAALFPGKTPADGFTLLVGRADAAAPPAPVAFPRAAGPPDDVRFLAGDTLVAVQSSRRTATTLFDAEGRVPVAYVTGPGPTLQFSNPSARQLCWLLPDPKDAKKSLLLAASADFDDYQPTLAEARAARQPVALVLTDAGVER